MGVIKETRKQFASYAVNMKPSLANNVELRQIVITKMTLSYFQLFEGTRTPIHRTKPCFSFHRGTVVMACVYVICDK